MQENRLLDQGKDEERKEKKTKKIKVRAKITAVVVTAMLKLLIPLLIILSITSLLAGFVKHLRGEVFKWSAESTEKMEELEVVNTEEGCIDLSNEVMDELIIQLRESGLDVARLRMLGDKKDADQMTDKEINEAMRKYIREYYAAELITQYPNMSKDPGNTKSGFWKLVEDILNGNKYQYQGCITLVHADENGNVVLSDDDKVQNAYLTYMNEDDFNALCTGGSPEAENHFTVKGNTIMIASRTITTEKKGDNQVTTTSYNITPLNFKAIASAYTMPMEFLLLLNLYTGNPEFTYALAKMAENSRIVLVVQDNVSTQTQEVTTTYREKEPEMKQQPVYVNGKPKLDASGKPVMEWVETGNMIWGDWQEEEPTTVTTESHTPSVQLALADTWIVRKQVTYKKQENNPDPEETDEENSGEMKEEKIHTKTTSSSTTYVEDTGSTKEEEKTKLVLGLLRNKDGIYEEDNLREFDPDNRPAMKYVRYKIPNTITQESPHSSFKDSAKAVIDELEKNEDTQNQAEIMKYLMYIYTGNDVYGGATEFDQLKDLFVTRTFMSVAGGDELTKQFIRYFEGNGGEKDGKYIVYKKGKDAMTVGYGVNIETHRDMFLERGVSPDQLVVGGLIDKEIVDQIEDVLRQGFRTDIINGLAAAGITLKEFQIDALTSRAYNCGSDGALNTAYAEENFLTACKKYWSEADEQIGEPETESMYQHPLYTKCMRAPTKRGDEVLPGLIKRRKAEWLLFKTGCYSDGAGTIYGYWSEDNLSIGDSSSEGGSTSEETSPSAETILKKAYEISDYMRNNKYHYSLNGNLLKSSFAASKKAKQRVVCCATYVSWVLQEAGYNVTCHHHSPSLYNYLKTRFTPVTSFSQLQPGDIVFMDTSKGKNKPYSHVQIYAGDETWYNAGGKDSVETLSYPYVDKKIKPIFTIALRPN